MVIITACPYSGTKYTVKILRNLGLDVGHETLEKDGAVSWRHIAMTDDDQQLAALDGRGIIRLHQVRHPLITIASLQKLNGKIWYEVAKCAERMHLPWNPTEGTFDARDHTLRTMRLWYYWNKNGMEAADEVYCIEDLPFKWGWFLKTVSLPASVLPGTSTTTNRHRGPSQKTRVPSWNELYEIDGDLTLSMLRMAHLLGYTQVPVHYIRDPFYNFPDHIRLTLGETECL